MDHLGVAAAVHDAVMEVIQPLLGQDASESAAQRVVQLVLAELRAEFALGRSLQDELPAH